MKDVNSKKKEAAGSIVNMQTNEVDGRGVRGSGSTLRVQEEPA